MADDDKNVASEETGTAEAKDDAQAPQEKANKKAESPAPPAKGGRSSTRERKSTTAYVPQQEAEKKTEIADGSGKALSDHPNVVDKFKAVTYSSESLHDLHHIVFGGRVKKTLLKGNLLAFSGLVYPDGKEDEAKEKVLGRMYKLKLSPLRAAIDLVDFSTSGLKGKEEICDGFLAWLENPQPSGKELSSKKKGKRKSTSKKAPAKSKEEKKPAKKKAKSSAKSASKADEDDTQTLKMIPGVPEEKLRTKIKSIIGNSDVESVTVKDIRKQLEHWLDMDSLADYKETIRSIVMHELSS